MFARWGQFVFRHRWSVLLTMLALLVVAVPFAGKARSLVSGGWFNRSAESSKVQDAVAAGFGQGKSNMIVVFRANDGRPAKDPAVSQAVVQALAPLKSDARIAAVTTYAQTQSPQFLSTDGTRQYALVNLVADDDTATNQITALEELVHTNATAQGLSAGDRHPRDQQDDQRGEPEDLERAESVTLPISLIILTLVFGSLIAAFLPLVVAGFAIMTTLAVVYIMAQLTDMSIFVVNIVTMLGLALAIDYSLFIVNRYKEELRNGRDRETALAITLSTAGKAVVVSGITVAIGLFSLALFPSPPCARWDRRRGARDRLTAVRDDGAPRDPRAAWHEGEPAGPRRRENPNAGLAGHASPTVSCAAPCSWCYRCLCCSSVWASPSSTSISRAPARRPFCPQARRAVMPTLLSRTTSRRARRANRCPPTDTTGTNPLAPEKIPPSPRMRIRSPQSRMSCTWMARRRGSRT